MKNIMKMAGIANPWRGFLIGLLANAAFFLVALSQPAFDRQMNLSARVGGAVNLVGMATSPLLAGISLAFVAFDMWRYHRSGDGTGAAWIVLGMSVNAIIWLAIFLNLPGDCACGPA